MHKKTRFCCLSQAKAASLCSVAVSAISISAIAYEARANSDENADIEEIVVIATPIRDSQIAAIERKKNSNNVMNVISSDLVGRFPDQNLADSLGRVPGLAIERDQGQARFINFRGAPFRFTSIAFDGIDVAGAENGRVPRFDSFPSAITSNIEVNKAITPDMPGEAVAGFVNIRTSKPFDREGFAISFEGGHGEQELGRVGIDKYNGRISYANDVFGILFFGSHNKRGRITDNREYQLQTDEATGGAIPDNLDFRSYRGEREDNAYGGSMEFRRNETTRIFASSMFSEFIDREERNQFEFDFDNGTSGVSFSDTPITPDSGYQPVVQVSRLLQDGLYSSSTFTNTIGLDTLVAGWDIEGRASHIKTENRAFLPIPFSAGATIAAQYDLTDVLTPQLSVFATATQTPVDINSLVYPANFSVRFYQILETENHKFKLDAARDTELFGLPTRFKTGLQLDLREASGGSATVRGSFPSSVDIASFNSGTAWSSDFDNTIGGTDYDNRGLRRAWESAAGSLMPDLEPEQIIGIEENIFAAYVMATSDFDGGSFVYGLRVEHTEFSSDGRQLVGDLVAPISGENSYTDFLPAVHINIDLAEDLKLRFSATTGVSRPTYAEARASVSVDPTELEVTGGDPNLKAEYAYGGDVALEYYFAEASLISAGGFVRYVDNVLYADAATLADGSRLAPGLIAPGTATRFNSFFNGEDGKLYGVELNFAGQPCCHRHLMDSALRQT